MQPLWTYCYTFADGHVEMYDAVLDMTIQHDGSQVLRFAPGDARGEKYRVAGFIKTAFSQTGMYCPECSA
jgi:hypothetical protein